jgi:hypothetical protein
MGRQALDHPAAGGGDRGRDRHRAQRVGEAVEVEQQQEEAGGDQHSGQGDADVGDRVVLDMPQQRERERQGAGEGGQDHLLEQVAVPQAHEAGRQCAGGLLDDEDADGDHEPEQGDHGSDEDAEHPGGGRGRVLPGLGQLDAPVEPEGELPHHRAEQGAEDREGVQAALELLAKAEGDPPGHRGSPRRVSLR